MKKPFLVIAIIGDALEMGCQAASGINEAGR
jgi:hypothetical protein